MYDESFIIYHSIISLSNSRKVPISNHNTLRLVFLLEISSLFSILSL